MKNEYWEDSDLPFIQVSNLGNFRKIDRYVEQRSSKGNIYNRLYEGGTLYPVDNGLGYLQVKIYVEGKTLREYAHRLVWKAFNGEIPDGFEIDHINCIKSDCRLVNLQLMSRQDNMIKCHKNNPHIRYNLPNVFPCD